MQGGGDLSTTVSTYNHPEDMYGNSNPPDRARSASNHAPTVAINTFVRSIYAVYAELKVVIPPLIAAGKKKKK
jgi:hypothetical protein